MLNAVYVIFIECKPRDIPKIKWKHNRVCVPRMVQSQAMAELMERKPVEIYLDLAAIHVKIFVVIKVQIAGQACINVKKISLICYNADFIFNVIKVSFPLTISMHGQENREEKIIK